jgi:hypothetical protein
MAELDDLRERGPDFDGLDYPDAVSEYEADERDLEDAIERERCVAAGTHLMAFQGSRHFEGDAHLSVRAVHACESCGFHAIGIAHF